MKSQPPDDIRVLFICDSDPNIFGLIGALETRIPRAYTRPPNMVWIFIFLFRSPALWYWNHPQNWEPRRSKPGKHHRENGPNIKVILGMRDNLSRIHVEVVTVQPIFVSSWYEQFAAYINRGLCNPRLIFPRINGPLCTFSCTQLSRAHVR